MKWLPEISPGAIFVEVGNAFGNIRVGNELSAVHEVAAISLAIALIERACQASQR